jgi:hypothetical protein
VGGGIRNNKNKPNDTSNGAEVNTEAEHDNIKTREGCEGKLLV